ncbi:hypothetical protein [Methylobacterium radiotolerans]|uniref:hypothetical protein n=1 Tax=Methylobacterium radiotolerans TaxID=31998 RepID=UPI001F1C6247|nr:hypothetical protein [Methylobacterium radiotolerans]UIY43422.1 hypothetical protein LZ599_06835 [Methylobacterium radiotolerans]
MPTSRIDSPSDALRQSMPERPGFRSFKTAVPIAYPSRWHRDLLIQATLDPAIEAIEPGPAARFDPEIFQFFIQMAGVRQPLVAIRHADNLDGRVAGSGLVKSRAHTLSEPRCTAARIVWAARKIQVSAGDRIRILKVFDEAKASVPFANAIDAAVGHAVNPAEAVLALVCEGQLEIDVSQPISPETLLRRRRSIWTR